MTRDPAETPQPMPAAESATAPPSSRARFWTLFPSIMLPMFLSVVDQTIVATALPAIAGSLGEVERVSWIVVSYLIANTIAAPVYGRLGDTLGRRRMMQAALMVFIVASLLCALATSIELLTLARLLQGLGGGGLMTLSQSLIGENIPPRERPRYQGYLAAVVVCSSSFGPVAGGVLTQFLGWRSIFLINLPLGFLSILLTLRLPRSARRGEPLRFDMIGLVLFAVFVGSILLALEQIQRFESAPVGLIVALFVLAAGALILLLRQEKRAAFPLLPLGLLRQSAIWRCDALAALHGAALISLITFIPIYFRVVRGADAAAIGLFLVPLSAGIGVGSMVSSRFVSRTGRTTIFPIIGLALTTVFLLFFAFDLPRVSPVGMTVLLGLISLSMGTTMQVVQLTVQMVAGEKLLGAAAGSVQFSRSVGATFGTAATGALLFVVLTARHPDVGAVFGQLIEHGPNVLAGLGSVGQAAAKTAVEEAFRSAFALIALFTTGGALIAASIPVRRL